jgi:hypothetical protein
VEKKRNNEKSNISAVEALARVTSKKKNYTALNSFK